MPLKMKVQPVDCSSPECFESVKAVPKSRLRRLFDFSSFLRGSTTDELEPSSVCLDEMVKNFIDESNEKLSVTDGSEDDLDSFNCFGNSINNISLADSYDSLKAIIIIIMIFNSVVWNNLCNWVLFLQSLVLCETVFERNLLADASKIVDKNKTCKKKDEVSRKMVADSLLAAGYTVSICKSRWDKTSAYPAGEYEYIDAITEGERVIIDIDFRSEFEIARSTKGYRAVLQMLPHIFVGRPDRLQNIINIVSDAVKQSLKKKGMPLPPWRRADYVKAKWLSPYNQTVNESNKPDAVSDHKAPSLIDELEIKPKVPKAGSKVVSGLASVIEGK
ncbi:uncharacterized protein LOC143634549 [Bidens hawaiensis]|uniref:uncharacterized protein LOC143634549 n=1 Tax=Bidens hawaiensis TaxID=980011 RepID=UPI0040499B11